MDKVEEALTLLRDAIDGVGRATAETANNPKWRYHSDTPHLKRMAGVYAEWAAAVQVIIDNLPALSHAAGQEVVDLEAFRKPVTAWRALASIGEIATEMPMRFKRTEDEYRARVAEADRLLAIIDTAVARSEGEG